MASKHTPHSGLHGPARIDQTKKNKARRAKKRARIAAFRALKVEGGKILRQALLDAEAKNSIAATA